MSASTYWSRSVCARPPGASPDERLPRLAAINRKSDGKLLCGADDNTLVGTHVVRKSALKRIDSELLHSRISFILPGCNAEDSFERFAEGGVGIVADGLGHFEQFFVALP
jgi:hypothetical protein